MMTIGPCESAIAVLALLACAAMVGCRPSGTDRPLVVVVSGDTNGWIVPCGCTSNQSGGLPRRATFIAGLRRDAEVVAVDVGGAAHGTSPYDLAKFNAILIGESRMHVAAHNIGAAEARFGPDELRRQIEDGGEPLLSANVRDASGKLVAEPVRIVSAAGRRLALVGVLAERYATPDLQVTPPRQAAIEALSGVAGKYDAAIVLAYLPEDELRQLADDLPEADVIVGGPTGQPIAPQRVGPTLLTSATNKGKFMARLDAPAYGSGDRWKGSIVELDGGHADDPDQQRIVTRFRLQLGRSDFAPSQTSFVEPLPSNLPKGYAVAGNAACKKCHEDDCRTWRKSKHAAAWEALKATIAHDDPECQRCHTTGYGLPGGFASLLHDSGKRNRVNVGCESCHGPSLAHVADSAIRTPRFARAKDCCTACHDRENSPKFDYDEYWEKIRHGQKATGEKQ
jgi:hypothetical protein